MRSIIPLVLAAIFLPVAVFAQSTNTRDDWPMINGDAQRTSYARVNLEFPLRFKALLQMQDISESGMAYVDSQVYVIGQSSNENTVVTFDLNGNTQAWTYPIPNTSGSAGVVPAISGNLLLASGQGATMLYSFTRQNGEPAWSIPSGSFFTRSPVVDNARAYYCQDSVYAISLTSGSTIWTFPQAGPQISPVIDEDAVYMGNSSGVYAIHKQTGEEVWHNPDIAIASFTSLAVDDTQLYLGHANGLSVLDKSDGSAVWGMELPGGYLLTDYPNGICLADSHVVLRYMDESTNRTYYSVHSKTDGFVDGEWHIDIFRYMGPTLINNMVVEFDDDKMYFLDWLTGEEVYAYQLGEFSPNPDQILVVNNLVLVGSNGSVLVLEPDPSSTYVPDLTTLRFDCAPNPMTDNFTVNFELARTEPLLISLHDATGALVRTLYTGSPGQGVHSMDFSSSQLVPGTYSISMRNDKGQIATRIVQKIQ